MLWLLIFPVVLAFLYWYGVSRYSILANEPLNGPKPWPYIGNLLDVIRYGGMHNMALEYFKRYGRVHKMYIGRMPSIVVNDPEMAKQILVKDFHKFANRTPFIKPNPPFNSGLFFARDDTWKRVRSTLTPTFSAAKLKQIVPIIEASTVTLVNKMENVSFTGESVDCNIMFSLFALDVIMKAAFGYETDVQVNPDEKFVKKAKGIFRIPIWIRTFSMFPFADSISTFFKINLLRNVDYFLGIAQGMIRNRQEEGARGRRDLVQLMLEAHEETTDGVVKLTHDEIAAQSIIFLVAGFETTGTTLTNTAYHLATHPDIQDKLIEELDKARANRADTPLYEFIQHIDYLDRVICEILRLCTPINLLFRGCEEDCVIKGVHFPKGVDVNISTYVLHRDPEAWDHPETFDPDHFSPEAKEKRHPYSYMPFGSGPRQCIGMRFALMEIKIGLMAVLEKFRFKLAPQTKKLELEGVVVMRPKDPVILKIRKRSV